MTPTYEQLVERARGDGSGLFSYQHKWMMDRSTYKIGLWSRQTGKDYSAACEAVINSLITPKSLWVILACGERQATESMEKVKDWVERLGAEIELCAEHRTKKNAVLTAREVRLPNDSRIIALPAKPATVRGYSANVILTEFAFHENPEAMWKAIYPSISNPLKGGKKMLRIISTPNGIGNKFYDLWFKSSFAKHKVTLHQAVAAGLPLDIAELRQGAGSEETWAQEYLCEFMDTTAVLLPYELIQSCEDPNATTNCFGLGNSPGEYFVGIDIGRHHDLTVCWTFQRVNGVLWTREVLVLEKMSFPQQVEALIPRIQRARLACVDYTGVGVGIGDYLVQLFGEHNPMKFASGKVELCSFTQGLKAELFPRLRAAFERKEMRIPADVEVREDLHSVHRVVTNHGSVTYRAARNSDGHSDRCTALALALRAAQGTPAAVLARAIDTRVPLGRFGKRLAA